MAEYGSKEILISISNKEELEISEKLRIVLRIPKSANVENVTVLFNRWGENPSIIKKMMKTKEEDSIVEYIAEIQFAISGEYFFFFVCQINNGTETEKMAIKINRKDGKPYFVQEEIEAPYWIASVIPDTTVPQWAKDKIYYQIVLDRFYRSPNKVVDLQQGRKERKWGEFPNWRKNQDGYYHNNDFFCGNIKGVEEKLDYLKSLGVGVIYISPINKSGERYDRYASIDHMEIDNVAGDFQDLKQLHEKANEKGMHLILDVAFNHCSSENYIFKDALNNPKSRYRDWFFFNDNNEYRYWYNEFKDMPIFNSKNKEYQEYICGENGVIAKLALYVDGFRIDVAEEMDPFLLEMIRNRANTINKHLIIGEYWNKVDCKVLGKSVDAPTNYLYTNAILKYILFGEYQYFVWQVEDLISSYPNNTVDTMLNSLDTQDMIRALTLLSGKYVRTGFDRPWEIDKDPSPWHVNTSVGRKFLTEEFRKFEYENDQLNSGEYEHAKKLLKIAVLIQYFLPGNPCIYYGTEVGLHGYKDPFNRKCFPWENMDMELLNFYQKIGRIRNCYIGADSKFEVLSANENMLIFQRKNEQNAVLVAVNRTDKETKIVIPKEFENPREKFYLNSTNELLGPYGGIVMLR